MKRYKVTYKTKADNDTKVVEVESDNIVADTAHLDNQFTELIEIKDISEADPSVDVDDLRVTESNTDTLIQLEVMPLLPKELADKLWDAWTDASSFLIDTYDLHS